MGLIKQPARQERMGISAGARISLETAWAAGLFRNRRETQRAFHQLPMMRKRHIRPATALEFGYVTK